MNTALSIIRKWEGLRLNAYKCSAGVDTIGWGSTRYPNGTPVKIGDKISREMADKMLLLDVQKFENAVKSLVKTNINDNQLGALVSFAYNVGMGALSKSTLLKLVNSNPNNPKIRDEFMRWNRAGGRVIQGLVNRRKDEADLYFKSTI